jgi:hypothetical protein
MSIVSNVFMHDECDTHVRSGEFLTDKYLSQVNIRVEHTNKTLGLFEISRRAIANSISSADLDSAVLTLPLPTSLKSKILLKHVSELKTKVTTCCAN